MLNVSAYSKEFFETLKQKPQVKYFYWVFTKHRNNEWKLASGGAFPLNHVYEDILDENIGCTFICETDINLTWEETLVKLQAEQGV